MNNYRLYSSVVFVLLFITFNKVFPQNNGWNAPFIKVDRDAPNILWITTDQQRWNTINALGNDFVAMVKDSSLVSVLAVRDITQVSRLYAGSTFRFREAYVTLAVMYLTMTVVLSLVVQFIERRLKTHD